MRRRLAGTALTALATVLLTGCGGPAGTDGDLADDWKSLPKAEPFVPAAGVCHAQSDDVGYLSTYVPVDCATLHRAETIHLGAFTGADAERVTPPPAGSPAMLAAFADCDARASTFVGADWRDGPLSVKAVPPSAENWSAGGRWYRCDLYELDVLDGSTMKKHSGDNPKQPTGSLRDGLKQPSALAHACFEPDEWEILRPASCGKKHRVEYVGSWTAPYPKNANFDRLDPLTFRRCRSLIARYVGVPDDAAIEYRTGAWYLPPSKAAWARGDRGIRCFLWSSHKDLTRSLKGTGAKGLPLR